MSTSNYRAKVYVLDPAGQWVDYGTGNVDLVQDNYKDIYVNYLKVISDGTCTGVLDGVTEEIKKKLIGNKEEEDYILFRPILKEMEFQKTGGKLFWKKGRISDGHRFDNGMG